MKNYVGGIDLKFNEEVRKKVEDKKQKEKDMNDYNRGKRDIMLEMAREDLVDVASRIAVMESDLDGARRTKWDLVRKISLLESGAAFECLDSGEKLSLHDKIEHIKKKCIFILTRWC